METPDRHVPAALGGSSAKSNEILTFRSLLGVVRRNLLLIIGVCGCFILLGVAYVHTTKPIYRAFTRILIDPTQLKLLPHQPANDATRENLLIDSEIEVIRSRELLSTVAEREGVFDDPVYREFGLIGTVRNWVSSLFGYGPPPPDEDLFRRAVLETFKSQIDVVRVGLTFVIQISSSASDPLRAAALTNAVADEYLQSELESTRSKARHSNQWLRANLDQLRQEVIAAEAAAVSYKLENNILITSGGLIEDQQLAELSSKLVAARSETERALARYNTIRSIAASGNPDVAVEDVLNSSTINRLRTEYAEMTLRSADAERRFEADHPATLKLKAEIDTVLLLLREEIGRIAESAKSDYEIALARQASVEDSFERLKEVAKRTSEKKIRLREFERQAASSGELYQHMLNRLRETGQGATLTSPRARTIERAAVPIGPAWPNRPLVLVLSFVFGGVAACGLVIVRELLDDRVRSVEDLEKVTGSTCLGLVPRLRTSVPKQIRSSEHRERSRAYMPGTYQGSNVIPDVLKPWHKVLTDQTSHLVQTLRTVRLTLHINGQSDHDSGKCLVFSSTYSGEGKSTLAMLQAIFVANTGARTLLIDADTTNPTLTRLLAPDTQRGLVEFIIERRAQSSAVARNDNDPGKADPAGFADLLWTDAKTGLHFLPCRQLGSENVNDVFTAGTMGDLLTRLKAEYDFILVDLPPLMLMPDARVIAGCIDHVLYVAEWGSTDQKAVTDALRRSPEIARRVSGCILNKASEHRVKKYGMYYKS